MKRFFLKLRTFRFKKEFALRFCLLLLAFLSGVVCLTLCFRLLSDGLGESRKTVVAASFLVFFLLAMLSMVSTYSTLLKLSVHTDRRLQNMEKHNDTLRMIEKTQPFQKVLTDCLEYFNTASEGEYSARLLQKQAELDSMQSQINPHFLYNTLDSIRGQAMAEHAANCAKMIEMLSKIFRYTISRHDDALPLAEELENIENYMRLQQYRFSDKFEWSVKIEEEEKELLGCSLPKLTLQPIVENALIHGLEDVRSNGVIEIVIFRTQSRLMIQIADNGRGMDIKTLCKLNRHLEKSDYFIKQKLISGQAKGLGLVNVNARIKMLFGDPYGLTVYSTAGTGTNVQIALPLEWAPNGEDAGHAKGNSAH